MIPHPCRCETCRNKPCPALDIIRGKPYSNNFGPNAWWDKARLVTSIVGCSSHPLSSEYLNKEIIEELERRAGRLGAYDGKAQATRTYEAAIKLLKEGVPK